jgi:aarF domain-containing kinase
VHSYRHTRREVKAALGVEIEQLFDDFDPKPLASGSIAQVHKATLKQAPYRLYLQQQHQQPPQQQQQDEEHEQQVVVKVCHPNVAEHIRMDFKLVGWLSIAASKLPMLKGLPVRESVAQFTHTMTAQADLRVEAVHALRFHNNFAGGGAWHWVSSCDGQGLCSQPQLT